MSNRDVIIRTAEIAEVAPLSRQIPEFIAPPDVSEYKRRLDGVDHLILIAEEQGIEVAFKVGYARDNYFYSWMGAVLPAYRRRGIADRLAQVQQQWARQQGYSRIRFKTRNMHKGMLIFALNKGFDIIAVTPRPEVRQYRILLNKEL